MIINSENVRFKAARSSGPGGQKANRRSTKVQLWVKIGDLALSSLEKKRLRKKLVRHINHLDELQVENEEERSQKMNRENAFRKLNELISGALKVPKKRVPTLPRRSAEEARIRAKKIKSEKKRGRRIVH
ncbi:MAG: peptide chain release factor-like protein [Candidatus Jorgensenbacteria bacterium]